MIPRAKMAKKKLDEKSDDSSNQSSHDSDVSNSSEEPNFSDPEGYVDDISDSGEYFLSTHYFITSQHVLCF